MQGLRTCESESFIKYFEIVQDKARTEGCIYYLESEDGRDAFINDMEVCDLWGWLVPFDKCSEIEKIWKEHKESDEWIDYFVSAEWVQASDGLIYVNFVDYDYYA